MPFTGSWVVSPQPLAVAVLPAAAKPIGSAAGIGGTGAIGVLPSRAGVAPDQSGCESVITPMS